MGYGLEQLEALADGIEQIRVEHKIDKWHVVGHDAGSAIAVRYAHRFQERVDRLAPAFPGGVSRAEAFSSVPHTTQAGHWRVDGAGGERHFLEYRDAIRCGTATVGTERCCRRLSCAFFRTVGRLETDVSAALGKSRRGTGCRPGDAAAAPDSHHYFFRARTTKPCRNNSRSGPPP